MLSLFAGFFDALIFVSVEGEIDDGKRNDENTENENQAKLTNSANAQSENKMEEPKIEETEKPLLIEEEEKQIPFKKNDEWVIYHFITQFQRHQCAEEINATAPGCPTIYKRIRKKRTCKAKPDRFLFLEFCLYQAVNVRACA